jgi:beta-lactam-binding protein with PASTA domain
MARSGGSGSTTAIGIPLPASVPHAKPGSSSTSGTPTRLVVLCAGTGEPTTLPAVVPDVVGASLDDAADRLVCAGFHLAVVPRDALASGLVVAQSPAAGSSSPASGTVSVSVRSP